MSQPNQIGASDKPMRILVLRGVDGAGGGADEIILRNACEIDRKRFAMKLCFLRFYQDEAFAFERRCRDLGLDYCQVVHRGPFDRNVLPQIRTIIRQFQPEVVHSHEYKANFYSLLAAKGQRFSKLATCHGWTGNSLRERLVYYPGDRLVLRWFDRLIAVSDDIRNQLLRFGVKRERTDVVLNGVDPNDFINQIEVRQQARQQLQVAEGERVIGVVGRIEKQKRFDILLRTIKILRSRGVRVKLFIAGEGSLQASISQLIHRLDLTDSCRLLGHCPHMKELYQAFDVLVQSSDYEGTPTVVVEAMALRVPVVATDAGGTTQLIEDGVHGLVVPCRNPELLAAGIVRTIDNKNETAARVEHARKRVETELSFNNRLRKIESIYEQLCQGND